MLREHKDPVFDQVLKKEIDTGGGCFCCVHGKEIFGRYRCRNGKKYPTCKRKPGGFRHV